LLAGVVVVVVVRIVVVVVSLFVVVVVGFVVVVGHVVHNPFQEHSPGLQQVVNSEIPKSPTHFNPVQQLICPSHLFCPCWKHVCCGQSLGQLHLFSPASHFPLGQVCHQLAVHVPMDPSLGDMHMSLLNVAEGFTPSFLLQQLVGPKLALLYTFSSSPAQFVHSTMGLHSASQPLKLGQFP
jgi:hypothetical protein